MMHSNPIIVGVMQVCWSMCREVESIIGSMWKDMTNEDKQLWKQKATEQNNRVCFLLWHIRCCCGTVLHTTVSASTLVGVQDPAPTPCPVSASVAHAMGVSRIDFVLL